jgi:hypothetical protein
MKHLFYLLFTTCCIGATLKAQNRKPVQCNYVVENPKYYQNPMGYFVVTGWADTAQQNKVNDSLKAWFMKPTEYYQPKKPVAQGYKNYKKKKGETLYQYHQQCSGGNVDSCSGIILKDKDTLDFLGTSGVKGTGAHFCTWGTYIYDTNLLFIIMEYDPQIERDTFEDPAFFHLQTGEMIHPYASLVLLPEKKDSIRAFLMQLISEHVKGYEDYRIDSLNIPDSIFLSDWQIVNYYSGEKVRFYFTYVVDGKINGRPWHARLAVDVTYEELRYYYSGKLEEQLDKFSEPRK